MANMDNKDRKPNHPMFRLTLTPEEYRAVRMAAASRGLSITAYVTELVRRAISKEK